MHLSSIIALLLVSFASAKDLAKKERQNIRSASHASEMSADELHELMVERYSSSSKPAKKLSSSIETGLNASCTDSPQGWFDKGGSKYNCAYYEDNNVCATYGDKYENMGKTANEACCACGGGYTPDCIDNPSNWNDSGGSTFNCEWYAESNRCADFGSKFKNMGKNADEACCACGGGDRDNNNPTCEDMHGWKDSLGDGCSFYAQGDSCEKYGSGYKHLSKTANDACCVCGGGSLNERFGAEVKEAILMTKEERDAHSKMKTH